LQSFTYRDNHLCCDDLSLADLAHQYGTPAYVYSAAALRQSYRALRDAFAPANPLICYAVKANDRLAVARVLQKEGSGFDIVSGGELFRVLQLGADPAAIVYAGVGKNRAEIEAALRSQILLLNVESIPELKRINDVAGSLGATAPIALRLNPDIDTDTHRHTTTGKKGSKFGIDLVAAATLLPRMSEYRHVRLAGFHVHLGSPINTPGPYAQAMPILLDFIAVARRNGAHIEYLDIGGGYGIEYQGGETAAPSDYAGAILPGARESGCRLILEPGRFLVGNAAVLLTRVEYVKETSDKTFVICDAGMSDLIRPALYDAYHRIWPVRTEQPLPFGPQALAETAGRVAVDVVGPICESGDYLAQGRPLPPVRHGDLLAVFSAGAYGASMSSNYNSRPRCCEIMIEDNSARIIRERETNEDLIAHEHVDP